MPVLKTSFITPRTHFSQFDFPDLTDQFSKTTSITYNSTGTPRQCDICDKCGLVQEQGQPGILLWLVTFN